MKIKRKLSTICIIILLITISFTMVQASEPKKENINGTVTIEIGTINEKGNSIIDTISLSYKQLNELETVITNIIKELETAQSWEDIRIILNNQLQKNIPSINLIINIIKRIIDRLIELKGFSGKGFTLSYGRGFNFNPFKKSGVKMNKPFTIWHYKRGITLIWKPVLKIGMLKGMQFGFMINFKGLYMHIIHSNHIISNTFFIGFTDMIHGLRINRLHILLL